MNQAVVETIKLRATFLNSIASGAIVASVVTPLVGFSIGTAAKDQATNWSAIISACCFYAIMAVILHLLATRILRRLA